MHLKLHFARLCSLSLPGRGIQPPLDALVPALPQGSRWSGSLWGSLSGWLRCGLRVGGLLLLQPLWLVLV